MKMANKWAIMAAMITIIAITGFFLKKHMTLRKFTSPVKKVSIGVSKEPLTALCMIADENGYFSSNGLDADVRYYEGGNVGIRDMFEGKLDVVTVADAIVVYHSFVHSDFSIVATIGSTDNEPRIVARRDKGIIKPADIKGKRVGTVKGTAVHYFLHLFLSKYGMSEVDIEIILKDPADVYKLLSEGKVDAISAREPQTTLAVKLLGDNATVFSEPHLLVKNYDIIASRSFIKDNPETVKKILTALIQAERFVATNPLRSIDIVSKRLGYSDLEMSRIFPEMKWKVFLEQSMILRLEEQAAWMIRDKVVEQKEIPDYLQFLHIGSLESIKPEAVTIIR